MKKFYITTSIAYVNSKPHIGFAMELIQADSLARFHRLKGDLTWFLTGVDEHGVKIVQTAKEQGIRTEDLVEQNANLFKELTGILNLSNDDFIRTTSDKHKSGATKLWNKLLEKGDIYKHSYESNYCVGCEAFVLEKDLVDGLCPNHKKKPEVLKEENYFFKLSKYSEKIGKLIESDELKVLPKSRKNEILSLIKEGLTDVSFSRPKSVLPWGISVPNDDSQVMYVWCDALSNYITAINFENESEQFKKFWPADVHLIGKDILRFHAGVWIGMLLSASLPLPKAIYVHGFITSEGQKMSKSLGNVVDPLAITADYSVDALRYYLLREIPTADDGDFSMNRFKILYNTDLANNLGNLLSRVLTLTEKNLGSEISAPENQMFESWSEIIDETWRKYEEGINDFDIKKALEALFSLVNQANVYVDQKKPWILAKEEKKEELYQVLFNLLEILRHISLMLLPIIPETAEKIINALGTKSSKAFSELIKFGEEEFHVKKGEVLFPRRE